MKKSLKALILCGLASFVMFAVIYASPITAQATQSTDTYNLPVESSALEGIGLAPIAGTSVSGSGSVTFPAGLSIDTSDTDNNGIALVIEPDNSIGLLIFVTFNEDVSNLTNVTASYNVSYLGNTYVGTTTLSPDAGEIKIQAGYIIVGSVNSATGYGKEIQDLENKIGNISNDSTLTGENRVIEFNEGTALPGNIMAAMANSNGVTLKFTFWYEGFEFTTTITGEDAKKVYDPKVEWCGPCYLAENFPTVWTGKTVK